jgi:fluoride exporter
MNWDPLLPLLSVAIGGAIGATLRYAVYRTVDTQFPWATFIVNFVGCTLAAFLMFKYGTGMDNAVYTLLFVGIFGAFTTLSTFSIETVVLFAEGNYAWSIGNFLLNSFICVMGAFVGRAIAVM